MATDKWCVEDALNEVVRAIQDGSMLSITGLEDGYKRRYRTDFQCRWNDGYSWPDARETILPLAEMVGSLATMLSIYRAVKNGNPIPRTVDQFSAYMAGYLVAKGVGTGTCRPGVWCMKYYYMNPDPEGELDLEKVAERFGKSLGEVETYLKSDQPQ